MFEWIERLQDIFRHWPKYVHAPAPEVRNIKLSWRLDKQVHANIFDENRWKTTYENDDSRKK